MLFQDLTCIPLNPSSVSSVQCLLASNCPDATGLFLEHILQLIAQVHNLIWLFFSPAISCSSAANFCFLKTSKSTPSPFLSFFSAVRCSEIMTITSYWLWLALISASTVPSHFAFCWKVNFLLFKCDQSYHLPALVIYFHCLLHKMSWSPYCGFFSHISLPSSVSSLEKPVFLRVWYSTDLHYN